MSILSSSSSTCHDNFLKALSSSESTNSSHNNVRDPSFSSYLTNAEETFVHRLADSTKRIQTPNPHEQSKGPTLATDGEIGVFGAEKYFSGELDYLDSPRTATKIDPVMIDSYNRGSRISYLINRRALTASLASDESSWNSNSVLLQNAAARNNDSSMRKKEKKGKSFLANLGCKCTTSCLDGNSVDVDEKAKEIRTRAYSGLSAMRDLPCKSGSGSADDFFSFPTMNSIPTTLNQEEEEIPRESLEVFGSPVLQKRSKSSRKLKTHEESDSDTSSELLEIESLTGKAKAKTFLARQDSDGASSCYARSEASIEWSVVTASAADFSIMSDYDEEAKPASSVSIRSPVYKNILITKANRESRHLSSVLSGCKNLKSVGVAGDSYRIMSPRLDYDILPRDYSVVHKKSLEAESKPRDFESKNSLCKSSLVSTFPFPTRFTSSVHSMICQPNFLSFKFKSKCF